MARGKAYPTAIRALAFKWQRIMFVCWRDRVPYDETIYLQSLQRRGSHFARKLNQQLLPKSLTDYLRCMVRLRQSDYR